MNELHSSRESNVCDTIIKIMITLIYFLELKPKALHKSKNLPNIGRFMWLLNA